MIKNYLYKPKWLKILSDFPIDNLHKYSIAENITYCYLTDFIKYFETIGLLNIKKIGRTNRITLTPKGLKLSEVTKELNKLLNKVEK